MSKNTSKNLTVRLESQVLKKYKGKRHFAFLHLMTIGDIEYYSLYVVAVSYTHLISIGSNPIIPLYLFFIKIFPDPSHEGKIKKPVWA